MPYLLLFQEVIRMILQKKFQQNFLRKKIVIHEESLKRIKDYFEKRLLSLNTGDIKQAYIIKGSKVIPNDWGTAPGLILEEKKILILLPGPPREMIPMFENYVAPYILKFQKDILYSKVLRIFGIGEAYMEEKIMDIIEKQKILQ